MTPPALALKVIEAAPAVCLFVWETTVREHRSANDQLILLFAHEANLIAINF